MDADYDAIIIGAGHNGLVAAVVLASSGWKVLVVEANDSPGGALLSGEVTLPGYVHDLFATNLNLFLGSRFFTEYSGQLAERGFTYRTSSFPYANAFPDRRWLGVSTNLEDTLERLRRHHPDDAKGWCELYELFQRVSKALFTLYGSPIPSLDLLRSFALAARSLGKQGMLELFQLLSSSPRELVDTYLVTEEAKVLIASWGLHLDFGPDVSGGAVFPFLEAFSDMQVGMSVAEGGASRLVSALCSLITDKGGEILLGAEARRVIVKDGRAAGIELVDGRILLADKAVIANVAPTALVGGLVDPEELPGQLLGELRRYRYGPATMMIHLALSDPVPWAGGDELGKFAYVHLAPYLDDLARTYADALAGRLPREPLLVVGQTSAVDPSRAPGDAQVLWIQVRALPSKIRSDPEGQLDGYEWDNAAEAFADRVLKKLESYAPGITDIVQDREVLSPSDLERYNRNLVGGDSITGSMHLRQNFVFRPSPRLSRYKTPIDNLFIVGAGTWPGAGLNAASGYLAAHSLVMREKLIGTSKHLSKYLSFARRG